MKRKVFSTLLSLASVLLTAQSVPLLANATDLPPVVLGYLRESDAQVEIRFDGLITYSNGTRYLPVLPQSQTEKQVLPTKVIRQIPEKSKTPDLVQFDNNMFLIRLVPTSTGKLTLARMDAYPIELKEGLLPQDLVIPSNLFIPAELKVLLGALPYNPQAEAEVPKPSGTNGSSATSPPKKAAPKTVFLSNLLSHSLIAVDPDAGTTVGKIPFNCVPSSLIPSPDEKLLFATCLTTDELVVVDTRANLIKTRIPVGSKPADVLFIPERNEVVVSNRYSNVLNIINAETLLPLEEQVTLPTTGANLMVYNPASQYVYVADNSSGKTTKVYELSLADRQIKRTLTLMPSISAMAIPSGSNQLWTVSRTANAVQIIDLASGNPVKTMAVGKKPLGMINTHDKMFVISADGDRIDVIKMDTVAWAEPTMGEPIILPAASFPSSMAISGDSKIGYVNAAGSETLYLVDLIAGRMFKSIPIQIRGSAIALIGGEKIAPPPPPPKPAQVQALDPDNLEPHPDALPDTITNTHPAHPKNNLKTPKKATLPEEKKKLPAFFRKPATPKPSEKSGEIEALEQHDLLPEPDLVPIQSNPNIPDFHK